MKKALDKTRPGQTKESLLGVGQVAGASQIFWTTVLSISVDAACFGGSGDGRRDPPRACVLQLRTPLEWKAVALKHQVLKGLSCMTSHRAINGGQWVVPCSCERTSDPGSSAEVSSQCASVSQLSIAQTGPLPPACLMHCFDQTLEKAASTDHAQAQFIARRRPRNHSAVPTHFNIIHGHWRRLIFGAAQVMSDVPQTVSCDWCSMPGPRYGYAHCLSAAKPAGSLATPTLHAALHLSPD